MQSKVSYSPLIFVTTAVVLMATWATWQLHKPNAKSIETGEFCPGYCAYQPMSGQCRKLKAIQSRDGKPYASEVLEKRLTDYQSDKNALSTNMLFQLAFILIGLLVITSKSEHLETPIAGIKLPRIWLFYIVPLALTFFWLEFGFLTDKMIQTRHESWLLLESLAKVPDSQVMFDNPVKNDQITMQLARLFEDGGYIDGWFVAFRGCEHVINTDFRGGTNFFWSLVFGSLLGLTHAGAIFMAHVGNAKYLSMTVENDIEVSSVRRAALSRFAPGLPYMIILIILLSHYQFFSGGDNPNWMQLVIAAGTIIFGWLLIFSVNSTFETE